MTKLVFATLLLLTCFLVRAQEAVDVNLNVEHIVGDVSVFDRSKFIIIHDDIIGGEWESNDQQKYFLEDYDVYYGRNNGGIVWQYNNTKEDASNPGWPDIDHMKTRGAQDISNYASKTFNHQFENRYANMMIGGQEFMFPHGQKTNPPGNSGITAWTYGGFEEVAEYYANYLKHYFGTGGVGGRPAPRMLEVINEPFVKVNNLGTTREEMSRYHNVVAKRVKELNPEILVGGYTAAHPAFESNNFNHWINTWKLFIDIAGENMDFFSFHLYDFMQETSGASPEMYRAGSNIEAIMDMINHYSFIALGETKPWSISEFGWLCKECDGGYDPREDWYNLRSFNTMMVQLMERQDQILNAIPFMLLKANWAKPAGAEYNTYGPRLFREIGEMPGEEPHGGWIYTDLLKFYQLWANVKGTRIDTKTTDQDIMADAYVDGKKLYLILSSLEHEAKTIDLSFIDSTSNTVEDIMIKHLYEENLIAKLDSSFYTSFIDEVTLGREATMILEYTFSNEITVNASNTEQVYFADKYFQEINAGSEISFNINGITKGEHGEAILRLGLGRDHGKNLKPTLKVNGTAVDVPTDWRGYDQKTRDSFFGVIEVPVPLRLLETSNTISLKFPDQGGHVSSVVMQVFNFSRQIDRFGFPTSSRKINDFKSDIDQINIFPNPVSNVLRIKNDTNARCSYSIINMQGMKIRDGYFDERHNSIDMSEVEKGVYLLQISNSNFKKTHKVIKS